MTAQLHALSPERVEQRRTFLGASEARIVMAGSPEEVADLIAVKRGEKKSRNLSNNRFVQLGHATEDLNRYWYEQETGVTLTRVNEPPVFSSEAPYIGATLDGFDPDINAPFEAKYHAGHRNFDDLIERYYWQLQQQMLVTETEQAVLSVIFGANAEYGYRLIAADKVSHEDLKWRASKVWKCVLTGEPWPELPPVEAPPPAILAHKSVDMTGNNQFAIAAGLYLENRIAAQVFKSAADSLKSLMPDDARTAAGYGLELKRSRNGAITIRDEKHKETENA